ncbi:MAG: phosphodiester glycosidase family protein [Anaerolineales bacterium]
MISIKASSLLSAVLLLLLACRSAGVLSTLTPTAPSPTPLPSLAPAATATPGDTGWQPVDEGLEVRSLTAETSLGPERVAVVRLDPALFDFRVEYAPGEARPVSVWSALTGALLTVNAGYFTAENLVTGLTVSEGVAYGVPYGDYAGMFAVTPEGAVSLRWLRAWPYDPAEPLRSAVQSFPVLVKPGGVMGFPVDADEGLSSRRTVVAQDRAGRLLFLVAPVGRFSLHELAVWLTESDLEIDVALNLDGGTSTGMWLRAPGVDVRLESYTEVPAVIAVYRR